MRADHQDQCEPEPPGGGGATPAGRFACYKVKCPKDDLPAVAFADQFGSRTLVPSKSQLLCAPETGLDNEPPVANAGPDQALPDVDGDGSEPVALFASQSQDPEGGALTYIWSEGGVVVGTSESLATTLPIGEHPFTLTVIDAEGATDDDTVTVTVPEVPPGQVVIASDGFESASFSGGTGWAGAWVHSGDVAIRNNQDGPHSGLSHIRLRSSTGLIHRTVNLTGVTAARLRVWIKGNSFEASETASVGARIGSSFPVTTLLTLTSAQSDNQYHFYDLDLSPFASSSTEIEFRANMSGTSDNFYVDAVEVWGIR